jgi:hypothetical protein
MLALFVMTATSAPEELSPEYIDHINQTRNTFTCFADRREIPLSSLNNGQCDCCDGSDEFLNLTYCYKTCPISLNSVERQTFQQLFQRAIFRRLTLGSENDAGYKQLASDIAELKGTINATRDAHTAANKKLEDAQNDLKSWVYRVHNREPPDPSKEKVARKAYVNREDNVRAAKAPDDEENDEEAVLELDEADFKRRKQHRKAKWEWRKEEEYQQLLKAAIEMSQPEVPGVLGKLKSKMHSKQNPPEYQAVLDAREALSQAQVKLTNLLSDVRNGEDRLAFDLGPGHLWFDVTERSIHGPVFNTDRTIVIDFFRRAQLRLPSTGCANLRSLGVFKKRTGNVMEYWSDRGEGDGRGKSLTVRFVCYPEDLLISASSPSSLRTIATVGLPEACNTSYTEQDFQNFLAEVQPYAERLLPRSEL